MIKLKEMLMETMLTEYSKNDPIPELTRIHEKLCVLVVGPPGSGKSTFVTNFIKRLNKDIVSINPDDISLALTKKPNIHAAVSIPLSVKKMQGVLKTKSNIVYDATGNDVERLKYLNTIAKESGYTVLIVHLYSDLSTCIKQNIQRDRTVDIWYLKSVYKTSQSLMSKYYTLLEPSSYYFVLNSCGKYHFYKYNGHLLKRKNDKYV